MLYIKFRKKFILPVRFFLEERKAVKTTKVRDVALIHERLSELRAELVRETKYERRAEMAALQARIAELEWIIYAKTD